MENKKAEFFIPLMVNKLINEGTATVKVLDTTSKWFGVTYAAILEQHSTMGALTPWAISAFATSVPVMPSVRHISI